MDNEVELGRIRARNRQVAAQQRLHRELTDMAAQLRRSSRDHPDEIDKLDEIANDIRQVANRLKRVSDLEPIPEVISADVEVDTVTWTKWQGDDLPRNWPAPKTITVTCPSCDADSGWRLWTRLDDDGNPAAGVVCRTCHHEFGHVLVYPDYVRVRAARVAAGIDETGPRLERTIAWQPHYQTSPDLAEWDSTAIARVTWRPLDAMNASRALRVLDG